MAGKIPLELPAERPVLLLDIDGVINVFQCAEARETRVSPHLPALKLLPGVEGWLAQLSASFYLIWCAHQEALSAMEALPLAGTPRPALTPAPEETGLARWKLQAVRRTFASWPGALAWVEDGFSPEARGWAAERLRLGQRTWLVDVSESGLTAEITDQLLHWAQG